ncbi:mechanosensitive ion channel family protein [Leptolyngbya sp. FACHB-261]|uniref:mechanosensitive ion channel family protein n=1 Tax=Leptolyngbya sp. FACHB-261 TaxID=2692806 RepID=UPI001684A54F|nr:mechanosensitive ion channel family protein [Leptolyngbya sp. FACHB-261]MBD2102784.1 mechanosensitive ion channel family protein [Leptolyngbya sp. FACHB-261]
MTLNAEVLWELARRSLLALGILIATRVSIRFVHSICERALTRAGVEPTLKKFLIQASEVLTLAVGILTLLPQLGVQSTSLVAVLGTVGLAIGLALQNTLSHFAAGVMLILLRPFEVGDFIEAAGVSGMVDAIGIFSTVLITPDHVKIIVPNNNLFGGVLKNTSALGTRRVDLELNIEQRSIEATIECLQHLMAAHPLVLEQPAPECHVSSLAVGATTLCVRPWCKTEHYNRVRSEIQQQIQQTLSKQPQT